MRKSCDVTDAVKTFRKSINTGRGRDGPLIPIKIHKINPASFGVFTECFDGVCDVTRLSHLQELLAKPLLQLILSVCISHHHGEDGEELLLGDAVVAVEVVHPEGDCAIGIDK